MRHIGTPESSQLVWWEARFERLQATFESLHKAVAFYRLAEKSEHAKETGVRRDALEWLIEEAQKVSDRVRNE